MMQGVRHMADGEQLLPFVKGDVWPTFYPFVGG